MTARGSEATEEAQGDSGLGPIAADARTRVLDLIAARELRSGDRVGAERERAESLGVSRSTLRQALGILEGSGVIRRVPGRSGGIFVAGPKVERDLSQIVGVPDLLREQGFTAGSRLVSVSVVPADDKSAAALNLAPGAFVVSIVRIRLADGVPISLEHARLPADKVPGLPERELGGSLYELLEREYGLRPHEATERIEVMHATTDEAAILGIRLGDALLSVQRTTVDADGVPFEYSHDLFRADRTRIVVRSPGIRDSGGASLIGVRDLEFRTRGAR